MPRKKKYDRSRLCVKCRTKDGNIVIRHAVYCKDCFIPLVTIKFRRGLDPYINPVKGQSRKKARDPAGNLLLGLSGGLGSTALLDLINRCYLSNPAATVENDGQPKGGVNHPRNRTWGRATAVHVDVSSAIPNMQDKTQEIKEALQKYPSIDYIGVRVEDAFDKSWWERIVGGEVASDVLAKISTEALPIVFASDPLSPVDRLRHYLSTLPTQTAITSSIKTLVRVLLLAIGRYTSSSHILLGTSLTSLSISLISSISQGSGFVVRETAFEEWNGSFGSQPDSANGTDQKSYNGTIRIVRPLQDISVKECAIWCWWAGIVVVGREKLGASRQDIEGLTRDFIVNLERDYPSTISTIVKTCAKLAPKADHGGLCLLCQLPVQTSVQEWKARISIRNLKPKEAGLPTQQTLAPLLCYSCHTTLTSRSSRRAVKYTPETEADRVTLPVWAAAALTTRGSSTDIDNMTSEEIWRSDKMDTSQLKNSIQEFLIED